MIWTQFFVCLTDITVHMIRETWNDSNFLTRNGITKPSLNLKAEICEYGDQREGIICDMIINCVNNRKCANEENITRIKIK